MALLRDTSGAQLRNIWEDSSEQEDFDDTLRLSVITFGTPTALYQAVNNDFLSGISPARRALFHNVMHSHDAIPLILNVGQNVMKSLGRISSTMAQGATVYASEGTFTADRLVGILSSWTSAPNETTSGAHFGRIYYSLGNNDSMDGSNQYLFRKAVNREDVQLFAGRAASNIKEYDLERIRMSHSMKGYRRLWKDYVGSDVRKLNVTMRGSVGKDSELDLYKLVLPNTPTPISVNFARLSNYQIRLTITFGHDIVAYTFLGAGICIGANKVLGWITDSPIT